MYVSVDSPVLSRGLPKMVCDQPLSSIGPKIESFTAIGVDFCGTPLLQKVQVLKEAGALV